MFGFEYDFQFLIRHSTDIRKLPLIVEFDFNVIEIRINLNICIHAYTNLTCVLLLFFNHDATTKPLAM